jgi:hypothetical protein
MLIVKLSQKSKFILLLLLIIDKKSINKCKTFFHYYKLFLCYLLFKHQRSVEADIFVIRPLTTIKI